MTKYIITNPKPINLPYPDMSNMRGGFGKEYICPECQEGVLKFIECDNDNDVSEILYECNVCHMPHRLKLIFEGSEE